MGGDQEPTNPIPRDLLDAGDPRFVAELRAVADAAGLARFAADWFADRRPASRQLLFAYLDEAPNAPGHEGLIKRLFKLAEAAGDDEVMARFLVLADRLIVRRSRDRFVTRRRRFATVEEAEAQQAEWIAQGWVEVARHKLSFVDEVRPNRHLVVGTRRIKQTSTRGTTLPRPDWRGAEALASLTADDRAERRWFSVATRRYLQRRAWRYFRKLGRTDPARYVAAASTALGLYRDSELPDGYALLDHFGLMRLLFDLSPVLRFRSSGCDVAPGHTLAELAPSPAFGSTWGDHPEAVLRVLADARARVVARWSVRMVEVDREGFRGIGTMAGWVDRLDRADPEVVALSLMMLAGPEIDPVRSAIAPERWVRAAEGAEPGNRAVVCDFVARQVRPDAISRADAIRLALSGAEPLARLGWGWVAGQGGGGASGGG